MSILQSKNLKMHLTLFEMLRSFLTTFRKTNYKSISKTLHVVRLLKLSSLLMLKLDFNKVRSIDDKTLFVYLEDENHHIETVEPSKRDLQRSKMLYERLFDLEAFVDATLLDRFEIPGDK